MKRKTKFLSALLVIAMLLCCMAIPVMAEEVPAEPTPPVGEVKNPDGSVTIKEGFTIPAPEAADAPDYTDINTYPFAIFSKSEDDTEYTFMQGAKCWSSLNGAYGDLDAAINFIFNSRNQTASKNITNQTVWGLDVVIVLRRDFGAAAGEYAHSSTDDTRFGGSHALNAKTLTVDLNGKTLTMKKNTVVNAETSVESYHPFIDLTLRKIPGSGQNYQGNNGLTIKVENGALDTGDVSMLNVYCDAANASGQFGKFADFTFNGVEFITTAPLVSTGDLSTMPETGMTFAGEVTEYNISVAFNNCGKTSPTLAVANVVGEHEKFKINTTYCTDGHRNTNGDFYCDFCGFVTVECVDLGLSFARSEGDLGIGFAAKIPAELKLKTVKLTTPAGVITKDVSELTKDANGAYIIVASVDTINDEVTVEFLNESDVALPISLNDDVVTSYTTTVMLAINSAIDDNKADAKAEIEKLIAELGAKTEELQIAINDKVSMAELSEIIHDLEVTITAAYEDTDITIAGDIEDLEGEIAALETTIAVAKSTLETAVAKVASDLEEATANLNAAIALKADSAKLADEINKLSAAYAAADLVLSENDEALIAADAAMKSLADKLRADVDDHTARIDLAETMNTVQLIIVIAAIVIGAVAIVLPIIKGKKKED